VWPEETLRVAMNANRFRLIGLRGNLAWSDAQTADVALTVNPKYRTESMKTGLRCRQCQDSLFRVSDPDHLGEQPNGRNLGSWAFHWLS
jgi:hypothetical protein